MYQHILVTLDSRGYSEQILSQLLPFVGQAEGTIRFLSVYPVMRALVSQEAVVSGHQLEEQASAEALQYLNGVAARFHIHGIATQTDVRFGNPVEVVLHTAQVMAADLIVMPVPWFRGDGHPMAAETTTQIIHRSTVPVMVIQLPVRQRGRGKASWFWQR